MKQKQKTLKKLLKDSSSRQKLLSILGSDTVTDHFISQRDHEQGLQEVDPQLLGIVLADLMRREEPESSEESIIKIDVLNLSEAQLLAFCREKQLINLHQYLHTIRQKEYRQHSEYGYMLVNAFPGEFLIGQKCTHYHCRTTAHKIQSQYGIYRPHTDVEIIEDNNRHQSDSDFINDDQIQQSQQIVFKRKKKKIQQQRQQKSNNSSKKRSMKNMLESEDEEGQNKKQNRQQKPSKKKISKMHVQIQDEEYLESNDFLYEALQNLEADEILEVTDYNTIFEYLSQKDIERLMPIKEVISETVLFNNKKAKREQTKKEKGHKKKLAKSKLNLKQLSLEDLLLECSKYDLVPPEDLTQWEDKYELEDHPRLAHELMELNPEGYVLEGEYSGSLEHSINIFIQSAYRQYEINQAGRQENAFGEDLCGEDSQQEMEQEQDDEGEDESNYSIDSEQQQLGEL